MICIILLFCIVAYFVLFLVHIYGRIRLQYSIAKLCIPIARPRTSGVQRADSNPRVATLKFHSSTLARKTQRGFYADNTVLITVAGARDKNYSPPSHLVGIWSRGRQVFEYLNLPSSSGPGARIRAHRAAWRFSERWTHAQTIHAQRSQTAQVNGETRSEARELMRI